MDTTVVSTSTDHLSDAKDDDYDELLKSIEQIRKWTKDKDSFSLPICTQIVSESLVWAKRLNKSRLSEIEDFFRGEITPIVTKVLESINFDSSTTIHKAEFLAVVVEVCVKMLEIGYGSWTLTLLESATDPFKSLYYNNGGEAYRKVLTTFFDCKGPYVLIRVIRGEIGLTNSVCEKIRIHEMSLGSIVDVISPLAQLDATKVPNELETQLRETSQELCEVAGTLILSFPVANLESRSPSVLLKCCKLLSNLNGGDKLFLRRFLLKLSIRLFKTMSFPLRNLSLELLLGVSEDSYAGPVSLPHLKNKQQQGFLDKDLKPFFQNDELFIVLFSHNSRPDGVKLIPSALVPKLKKLIDFMAEKKLLEASHFGILFRSCLNLNEVANITLSIDSHNIFLLVSEFFISKKSSKDHRVNILSRLLNLFLKTSVSTDKQMPEKMKTIDNLFKNIISLGKLNSQILMLLQYFMDCVFSSSVNSSFYSSSFEDRIVEWDSYTKRLILVLFLGFIFQDDEQRQTYKAFGYLFKTILNKKEQESLIMICLDLFKSSQESPTAKTFDLASRGLHVLKKVFGSYSTSEASTILSTFQSRYKLINLLLTEATGYVRNENMLCKDLERRLSFTRICVSVADVGSQLRSIHLRHFLEAFASKQQNKVSNKEVHIVVTNFLDGIVENINLSVKRNVLGSFELLLSLNLDDLKGNGETLTKLWANCYLNYFDQANELGILKPLLPEKKGRLFSTEAEKKSVASRFASKLQRKLYHLGEPRNTQIVHEDSSLSSSDEDEMLPSIREGIKLSFSELLNSEESVFSFVREIEINKLIIGFDAIWTLFLYSLKSVSLTCARLILVMQTKLERFMLEVGNISETPKIQSSNSSSRLFFMKQSSKRRSIRTHVSSDNIMNMSQVASVRGNFVDFISLCLNRTVSKSENELSETTEIIDRISSLIRDYLSVFPTQPDYIPAFLSSYGYNQKYHLRFTLQHDSEILFSEKDIGKVLYMCFPEDTTNQLGSFGFKLHNVRTGQIQDYDPNTKKHSIVFFESDANNLEEEVNFDLKSMIRFSRDKLGLSNSDSNDKVFLALREYSGSLKPGTFLLERRENSGNDDSTSSTIDRCEEFYYDSSVAVYLDEILMFIKRSLGLKEIQGNLSIEANGISMGFPMTKLEDQGNMRFIDLAGKEMFWSFKEATDSDSPTTLNFTVVPELDRDCSDIVNAVDENVIQIILPTRFGAKDVPDHYPHLLFANSKIFKAGLKVGLDYPSQELFNLALFSLPAIEDIMLQTFNQHKISPKGCYQLLQLSNRKLDEDECQPDFFDIDVNEDVLQERSWFIGPYFECQICVITKSSVQYRLDEVFIFRTFLNSLRIALKLSSEASVSLLVVVITAMINILSRQENLVRLEILLSSLRLFTEKNKINLAALLFYAESRVLRETTYRFWLVMISATMNLKTNGLTNQLFILEALKEIPVDIKFDNLAEFIGVCNLLIENGSLAPAALAESICLWINQAETEIVQARSVLHSDTTQLNLKVQRKAIRVLMLISQMCLLLEKLLSTIEKNLFPMQSLEKVTFLVFKLAFEDTLIHMDFISNCFYERCKHFIVFMSSFPELAAMLFEHLRYLISHCELPRTTKKIEVGTDLFENKKSLISWAFQITPLLITRSTAFVGLSNEGATCYQNSVLQQLFMSPMLNNLILQIPQPFKVPSFVSLVGSKETRPTKAPKTLLREIQNLFLHLKHSTQAYYVASDFVNETSCLNLSDGHLRQNDAVEFYSRLTEYLEEQLDQCCLPTHGVVNSNSLKDLSYVYTSNINIRDCPHEHRTETEIGSPMITLNLQAANRRSFVSSVHEAFDAFFAEEQLSGLSCEACGGPDSKVRFNGKQMRCFARLPPVLIIQLSRFDFNFETMQPTKLNHRVSFDIEMDLNRFTRKEVIKFDSSCAKESSSLLNTKYNLCGVVVHKGGGANFGHYYSFIKDRSSNKWFKFDDETVEEILPETSDDNSIMPILETECFGGPAKASRGMAYGRDMNNNAYLLVYEQSSSNNVSASINTSLKLHSSPRIISPNRKQSEFFMESGVEPSASDKPKVSLFGLAGYFLTVKRMLKCIKNRISAKRSLSRTENEIDVENSRKAYLFFYHPTFWKLLTNIPVPFTEGINEVSLGVLSSYCFVLYQSFFLGLASENKVEAQCLFEHIFSLLDNSHIGKACSKHFLMFLFHEKDVNVDFFKSIFISTLENRAKEWCTILLTRSLWYGLEVGHEKEYVLSICHIKEYILTLLGDKEIGRKLEGTHTVGYTLSEHLPGLLGLLNIFYFILRYFPDPHFKLQLFDVNAVSTLQTLFSTIQQSGARWLDFSKVSSTLFSKWCFLLDSNPSIVIKIIEMLCSRQDTDSEFSYVTDFICVEAPSYQDTQETSNGIGLSLDLVPRTFLIKLIDQVVIAGEHSAQALLNRIVLNSTSAEEDISTILIQKNASTVLKSRLLPYSLLNENRLYPIVAAFATKMMSLQSNQVGLLESELWNFIEFVATDSRVSMEMFMMLINNSHIMKEKLQEVNMLTYSSSLMGVPDINFRRCDVGCTIRSFNKLIFFSISSKDLAEKPEESIRTLHPNYTIQKPLLEPTFYRPLQHLLLVQNASQQDLNGNYYFDGFLPQLNKNLCTSSPKWSKRIISLIDNDVSTITFTIYKCRAKNGSLRWYLSELSDNPGSSNDRDFYCGPLQGENEYIMIPPETNWCLSNQTEGGSSDITIKLIERDFNPESDPVGHLLGS